MADNLPALHTSMLVQDLDGQYAAVADPITGEVVPLSDVHRLADWKLALKAHRAALSEAARVVDEVILGEMDRNGSWTINRPGGTVRSTSPDPGDGADQWDGNQLHTVLADLVEQGVISRQALDSAVKITTEYTAKAAGVKALLKIPAVKPYVETCRVQTAKPRRVS